MSPTRSGAQRRPVPDFALVIQRMPWWEWSMPRPRKPLPIEVFEDNIADAQRVNGLTVARFRSSGAEQT